jgi:hypothetical protein
MKWAISCGVLEMGPPPRVCSNSFFASFPIPGTRRRFELTSISDFLKFTLWNKCVRRVIVVLMNVIHNINIYRGWEGALHYTFLLLVLLWMHRIYRDNSVDDCSC